jgi:ABC-type multidrug transport system permease subunit
MVLFIVEIVFTGNVMLVTFPLMLVMISIALGVYSFIIYVPRWIADNREKENKKITALLFSVWISISILV